MRRHSCTRLLDPKKLPGALVPRLKSEFAKVTREPVPNYLAELMHRLDGEPNDSEGDEQHHGPSTAKTADSADRRRRC
jgi:hypothetical protein